MVEKKTVKLSTKDIPGKVQKDVEKILKETPCNEIKVPEDMREMELAITYSKLMELKSDLIKEANILFGGSTDAALMVRKIEETFDKHV
jgi:hypothetical protein